MTDQLISFETAKLAKEKGLLNPTLYFYGEDEQLYTYDSLMVFNDEESKWEAPTQSLLHKWLREKHNMLIVIMTSMYTSNKYEMSIEEIIKPFGTDMTDSIYCKDTQFDTYEEALERGLIEALKLII